MNLWFCGNLEERDLNSCNIFIDLVSEQGHPTVDICLENLLFSLGKCHLKIL